MQTIALLFSLLALLTQPLLLLVRDAQGQPLQGLALSLFEAGPPETLRARCVTDVAGTCRMQVAPGAYLLRFDEMPESGDFAFYLAPDEEEQVLSFVLEQGLPLWDLSRDPAAAPQPFYPPSGPQDGPLVDQRFVQELVQPSPMTAPAASTGLPDPVAEGESGPSLLLWLLPAALGLLAYGLWRVTRKEGR